MRAAGGAVGAEAGAMLGVATRGDSGVVIHAGYAAPAYGLPNDAMRAAVRLLARTEAILLDPVYSGKGFAGLLGLVRAGFFNSDDNIVLLHTGGSAALFAYQNILSKQFVEAGIGLSSMAP